MKNLKIFLISLYNHEPLGLKNIYSMLVKDGFNTKIVYLGEDRRTRAEMFISLPLKLDEAQISEFIKLIREYRPDFIGFSVVSSHYKYVVALIKRIKNNYGFAKIILGTSNTDGLYRSRYPEN